MFNIEKEILSKFRPKGIWYDVIERKNKDGSVSVSKTERDHNIVVRTLPLLLSGLMANEATFTGGILFHAIGSGEDSWSSTIPSPTFDLTKLEHEYFRKTPDSINYIDGDGNPTVTITDTIRIKTTFDYLEANGHWIREQGLVGGNATSIIESGYFIDVIRHRGIYKDESVKLTRYIELIF